VAPDKNEWNPLGWGFKIPHGEFPAVQTVNDNGFYYEFGRVSSYRRLEKVLPCPLTYAVSPRGTQRH